MANLVRSAVSLVAIIFIMITTVDATASTIAEPPSSCPDIISSVIDCLSYIANGSIVDRPSKACCIGIASVIKGSTTVCLCKSLKEALSYDVPINMTRVLGLPVACSVKAAKIDCSGVCRFSIAISISTTLFAISNPQQPAAISQYSITGCITSVSSYSVTSCITNASFI
ncbi:non-specific lipid transfer protein GPI-anchored 31-like [Zingiber officinale]|uniref:non-specific lipid transfer protein GPI-anchored 31-like n=1 Tax=Zingiber officinale TaxID=94328 RepID=UPI001C4D856A|nr:non-specific lipid transfer protein GPI-anchored 31-like [Zingiber officinale]